MKLDQVVQTAVYLLSWICTSTVLSRERRIKDEHLHNASRIKYGRVHETSRRRLEDVVNEIWYPPPDFSKFSTYPNVR